MKRRLIFNRSGATAIEYALLAGFVSVALVVGALEIGPAVSAMLEAAGAGFAP